MTVLEALILGLIQGLTEFLPISSSGHIELGSVLLNLETKENLPFSIAVHAATALSTIIVFYKDIALLIRGFLKFELNEQTTFFFKILISILPVGVVGVLYEDEISSLFSGKVMLVGSMLLVTAFLLIISGLIKQHHKNVGYVSAFIIGLAQAIAIMPGISRSGATIATALLLNIQKEQAARFSFLMVLIPILGASLLKFKSFVEEPIIGDGIPFTSLMIGFVAALVSGLFACRWMIEIVKKGKLIYFAAYCLIVGSIAILSQLL